MHLHEYLALSAAQPVVSHSAAQKSIDEEDRTSVFTVHAAYTYLQLQRSSVTTSVLHMESSRK